MSTIELRQTDSKGRLTLPKQFANATLLLEFRGDNEIILRKAKVIPLDEADGLPPFSTLQPLSVEDRRRFWRRSRIQFRRTRRCKNCCAACKRQRIK
jgi:hypothetical protein